MKRWVVMLCLIAGSGCEKLRPEAEEMVKKITDSIVGQLEALACQQAICQKKAAPPPKCYTPLDPDDPNYVPGTPPKKPVEPPAPIPGITEECGEILEELTPPYLPECEPEDGQDNPAVNRTVSEDGARVEMCPCECLSQLNVVFRNPGKDNTLKLGGLLQTPSKGDSTCPTKKPKENEKHKGLDDECEDDMEHAGNHKESEDEEHPDTKRSHRDEECEDDMEHAGNHKESEDEEHLDTKRSHRDEECEDDTEHTGNHKGKKDEEHPDTKKSHKDKHKGKGYKDEECEDNDSKTDTKIGDREKPDEKAGKNIDESTDLRKDDENNTPNCLTDEDEGSAYLGKEDNPLEEGQKPTRDEKSVQEDEHVWRTITNKDSGLGISWRKLTGSEQAKKLTHEGRQGTGEGDYQVIVNSSRKNIARFLPKRQMNNLAKIMDDSKGKSMLKGIPSETPGKPSLYINLEGNFMIGSDEVMELSKFRYEDHNGNMIVYAKEDRYIWVPDDEEDFNQIVGLGRFVLEIPSDNKQAHKNPFVITKSSNGITMEGGPKIGLNCRPSNELTNVNLIFKSKTIKAKYLNDPRNRFAEIHLSDKSAHLIDQLNQVGNLGIKVHHGSDEAEWTPIVRKQALPARYGRSPDLKLSFRKRTQEEMELQFSVDGRKGLGGSQPYEVIMNDNPDICTYVSEKRLGTIRKEFPNAIRFENTMDPDSPAFVAIRPQLIFTEKRLGDMQLFPVEYEGCSPTTSFHTFDSEKYMYRNGEGNYDVFNEILGRVWGYRLTVNDMAFDLHPLVVTRGYSTKEREYECGPKVNINGKLTNAMTNLRLDGTTGKLTANYKDDQAMEMSFLLSQDTVAFLKYLKRHNLVDMVVV